MAPDKSAARKIGVGPIRSRFSVAILAWPSASSIISPSSPPSRSSFEPTTTGRVSALAGASPNEAMPVKTSRRVGMSHNNCQPLRGAGNAGVEPAVAVFAKRETFVEQHHLVPLRPLRLMHGQRVAIIEFIRLPADG